MYASNRLSSLLLGQKHSRTARLQRFALLLVSSCSGTAFICHRQRQYLTQLTARAHFIISVGRTTRIVTAVFQIRNLLSDIKEPKKKNLLRFFWRLKQVIPLSGEMSRSDKRVGRQRSVRVPRTVRVRQFEAQKKNVPSQDETFLAPQTGLEPVTPRLTAACSTD